MTEKKPEFPSWFDQGKNLAKTAKNVAKGVVKGGPIGVPFEVMKKRMDTCRKCDYFYEPEKTGLETPDGPKFPEARCTACGCFLIGKTNIAASECPKGKWGQWNPEK